MVKTVLTIDSLGIDFYIMLVILGYTVYRFIKNLHYPPKEQIIGNFLYIVLIVCFTLLLWFTIEPKYNHVDNNRSITLKIDNIEVKTTGKSLHNTILDFNYYLSITKLSGKCKILGKTFTLPSNKREKDFMIWYISHRLSTVGLSVCTCINLLNFIYYPAYRNSIIRRYYARFVESKLIY